MPAARRPRGGGAADDTARLLALAQEGQARADFLVRAGDVLGSSLDYHRTLREVARLAVPILADWAVVDIVDANGARRLAVAHVDPAKVELARGVTERYPFDPNAPAGAGEVLRSGRPHLYPEITDAMLRAAARDAGHHALLVELDLRSGMRVPLAVRGCVLGVMSFFAQGTRRFGRDDLALAEELARRAAVAVDNARLYEEAQRAIRARDEFLSVASHELRTPLTALELQLGGLARRAAGTDERTKNKLAVIARQVKRLEVLVENLLDVSRVMAGKLQLELDECDFAHVVEDVAARLTDSARKAGSALRLDLEPCRGRWDRSRLDQVVSNLLSNAIKYGANAPVDVRLRCEAERAELRVRDHGIGVPLEDQARIFERFERAVSHRQFGGLGLGLWIARQIAEAHGGIIAVDSKPGAGAEFIVTLPRA